MIDAFKCRGQPRFCSVLILAEPQSWGRQNVKLSYGYYLVPISNMFEIDWQSFLSDHG